MNVNVFTYPLRNLLGTFHANEKAQDAFEYLLVVGGVSVAVVVAMAAVPGLATTVTGWVEDAIDGVIN